MNQNPNENPAGEPVQENRGQNGFRWMETAKTAAFILMIAAAVFSLIHFRGDIRDAFDSWRSTQKLEDNKNGTRIYFDADASNTYALFGSGLAVLSQTRFTVYEADGNIAFSTQIINDSPAMAVGGNTVALYSMGGTTVTVADINSVRGTIETAGEILSVDMNEIGQTVVVCNEERYRSVVSVYDGKQKAVFQWKTTDCYVLTAALSPDGKTLAAVAMGQADSDFRMTLVFFRTDAEERYASCEVDGTLAYELHFVDNDTLFAVCDDRTLTVSSEGKILEDYGYGDDRLTACDCNGDTCLLALVDGYTGLQTRLASLKADGTVEECKCSEVRNVSLGGKYAALLYTEGAELRGSDLSEISGKVTIYNIRQMFCTGSGDVLLIYGSEAGFVDFASPFA